jgi:hypothetical protein
MFHDLLFERARATDLDRNLHHRPKPWTHGSRAPRQVQYLAPEIRACSMTTGAALDLRRLFARQHGNSESSAHEKFELDLSIA